MKKFIISAIAAASMTLTGCVNTGITNDTTPLTLNKNDSFAMQVLKSGFGYVPFDIADTEVPEDAYQNAVGYGTSAGLGLLGGGIFGALNGLGTAAIVNMGGSPQQDYIQFIAWVPADNIDITDTKAINDYVKKNYFKPALDAYIASDYNKKMERPAEFIDYADGEFKVKGEICYPLQYGKPKYDGCQMFWNADTKPTRYATPETGIPFEPSIQADRYIVVRIVDGFYAGAALLPYLQTDMMYAYVPALGHEAAHINRLAENVVHPDVPYVAGKDGAHLFLKIKSN